MKKAKEDNRPSFQFYPKDWMTDDGLRVCSLAAKGLWAEILCQMFFSPVRGALLHASGKQKTAEDLANYIYKTNTKVIQNLLDELEHNRVYDRLENGTIINRKMYHEWQVSRKRIEAVNTRWHTKDVDIADTKRIQMGEEEEAIEVEIEEGNEKAVMLEEIINYLNLKTGKHYKLTTPKTKDFINLRMAEGFSVQNFKTIIDIKTAEWGNDPKMAQYLRPDTLFGTKFEGYLNQKHVKSELETLANYQEPENE